ncbi:fimbrial protein [Rahnella sp. ChDrAdgB13]|uniref:fimbrial protein n=1 Tax=Rahnella sp. ChDrAdgB13 TaxID=1850581 RepID=UPI001AD856C4|nr:fimbrial protein [Rahnella sp. ChDrAdgB13]
MTKVTRTARPVLSLLTGLSLLSGAAQAGTSSDTLTVNVTVIAEPCTINGGSPVQVNFGDDILTTGVDGGSYIRDVDYNLACPDATNDDLKMTISGPSAGFDPTVLQGDQPALGIKLLSDGSPMPLNQPLNFNRNTPPHVQAVLVKDPAGTLVAGPMAVSATMIVEYQ